MKLHLKYLVIFMITLASCHKNSDVDDDSNCYVDVLAAFKQKPEASKIIEYSLYHRSAYLLEETSITTSDRVSYIINKDCDTICSEFYGLQLPCQKDLIFVTTLWER